MDLFHFFFLLKSWYHCYYLRSVLKMQFCSLQDDRIGYFDIQQIKWNFKGQWKHLGRSGKNWLSKADEPWCCHWFSTLLLFLEPAVSNFLRRSEERKKKSIYLWSQVLLGWGSSALMQEDVALTEAACPLSKSNYDNHASGKAVARRTAIQALIRQAAYLNHSSPPLQTPCSANVDGPLKGSLPRSQAPVGSSVMVCCWCSLKQHLFLLPFLLIKGEWRHFCLAQTAEWCFLSWPFGQYASEA